MLKETIMRKINLLTPSKIKKMINEERKKIDQEIKDNAKKEKKKLLEALRVLKKIKLVEQRKKDQTRLLSIMKSKLVKKIKR
jgi:hypothetical protein